MCDGRQLAPALEKVVDAGPDGEDGGEDGGIKRADGQWLEHRPADGEHLANSADLACPVRANGHASIDGIQNADAREYHRVASEDEGDEPRGDLPAIEPPWVEAEDDEACEQEGFVRKGI